MNIICKQNFDEYIKKYFSHYKKAVIRGKGPTYKEIEEILESIEIFAKNAGIKRLYGGGRKGWIRKIKHLGFEQEYLIRKEL